MLWQSRQTVRGHVNKTNGGAHKAAAMMGWCMLGITMLTTPGGGRRHDEGNVQGVCVRALLWRLLLTGRALREAGPGAGPP